jgi:adenylate cyclase
MAEEPIQRKLTAILAADVVGYSRLVRANEVATLSALNALRKDIIDPKIAEHHGRIVKLMGDGILAEFPSVVDAVQTAAEVQRAVAERSADQSEKQRIAFRIGINLGDVIIDGDDIQGDGVNVAARLEGLSEPGGMCISAAVYEQVRDRIDLAFEDLGEQEVKNIDRPVRVWRWSIDGPVTAEATAVADDPLPLPDKPSIAVLPFVNMSGDPDQEYFSDGITEDIITALSRIRQFFVIARNTAFTYKGHAVDIPAVARDLGVRYVLEGSVRKVGNRVRVSAQLIDGESGNHIWAERYDRGLEDIFAVQDEITQTVVGAVQPELSRSEQDRARRKRPDRLDAWDLYQRGLWHYFRREQDDTEKAEKLFLKAIDLDDSFSSAYAGLSEVCYIKLYHGWTNAPDETLECGLRAGKRAVSLDDRDAFANFALGRIHTLRGNFEEAISEFDKALALNPNLAIAYYGLGVALHWSGRAREALPLFHKAIRQSPSDPLLHGFETIIGAAHVQLGEHAEAVKWCKKASRHPTSSFWTHTHLAIALVALDRIDDARVAINSALRKQPDLSLTTVSRMLVQMHPTYLERILDGLQKADMPK